MGLSGGLLGEKSETCACRHDRGDGLRICERSGEVSMVDLVECQVSRRVVSNMGYRLCCDGSWGKGSELTFQGTDWLVRLRC